MGTFSHSKNWFNVFELYCRRKFTPFMFTTNSPEFGNPTVESTSIWSCWFKVLLIIIVLGWIENSPITDPLDSISLL